MTPQPLAASKKIKIAVFADPGWGKTRFLATSPGRVLIIRPPFEQIDAILPGDWNRCDEEIVRSWDDMEQVFEMLRHGGKKKYDWVWLDSISGFQDAGLDDLWETIIADKPARKRYGLDQGDYGVNMFRLAQWVRDIASLSDQGFFNFGITAWPSELLVSDDEEVSKKLMPWVQGKNMANKVCGYMKIVAFGEILPKGTRVLRFEATERYYAKDSFDMFPDNKLLRPTMDKVQAAAEASLKKKAAARPKRAVVNKSSRKSTTRRVKVRSSK
jgi:hypothetical protein